MPPFVLTLLAQGLGILGNAVLAKGKDVISEKLGVDVEALSQSPEGLLKLKQLEVDHEEFLINGAIENRKIDLQDKALDIGNTENARDSNVKIQESTNASWLAKNTIYIIAFTVIIGGGWMLCVSPQADVRMAAVGAITLVLGFFFGTTQSSQKKDTTISNLAQGVQQ
jgi:ABC-type multidrug transport system fused ATPase/permease subunit